MELRGEAERLGVMVCEVPLYWYGMILWDATPKGPLPAGVLGFTFRAGGSKMRGMSEYPPPPPVPEQPQASVPQNSGNGGETPPLAIIGLVLGILSILTALLGCCCGVFTALPAAIMGGLAAYFGYSIRKQIEEGLVSRNAEGLAMGALVTGGIGCVLGILFSILGIIGLIFNLALGAGDIMRIINEAQGL